MRILYVSNGSNFLGAGGMEYHLVDVTGQLKERGVKIGFAVRKGTFLERELLAGEPDVFPLTCTGIRKVISWFQLLIAIVRFKPDIISVNRERDVVQTYLTAKLYNIFFNKKTKLISVFHNIGWKFPFNIDRLDGAIFPNLYIKNEYIHSQETNHLQRVIYHGINIDKFFYKNNEDVDRKRKFFTGKSGPIIGMVGEFRKNQMELVDVAICLRAKTDKFTFAVVGRGSEEEIETLNRKIGINNLENHFIVTGNVQRDKIPDIFCDLDISITTNRVEPFGMVFIESLASYTPLIAYNSGGPVEILANGGGHLVDGGPEDMAEHIFCLISNAELRCRMGIDARKSAEQFFSIASMGQQHFDYYVELLHS